MYDDDVARVRFDNPTDFQALKIIVSPKRSFRRILWNHRHSPAATAVAVAPIIERVIVKQ